MKYKSPYLIGVKEIMNSNSKIENKDYLLNTLSDFSPRSGHEKKYEPHKWNNNESIKRYHNCYAYALNHIASKRLGKPQPGYFSGIHHYLMQIIIVKLSINVYVKMSHLYI